MRFDAFGKRIAMRGEAVCGDAFLIQEGPRPLVVIADGLGHGQAASEAAEAFVSFAGQSSDSPQSIIVQGSRLLTGTRGVVAMVARFDLDERTVVVAGVGNIELRTISRDAIAPISAPGIVGRPLRSVREFSYKTAPGDLFVFASDGVSRRAELHKYASLAPQQMAESILADHGRNHDDATCVVVKLVPAQP